MKSSNCSNSSEFRSLESVFELVWEIGLAARLNLGRGVMMGVLWLLVGSISLSQLFLSLSLEVILLLDWVGDVVVHDGMIGDGLWLLGEVVVVVVGATPRAMGLLLLLLLPTPPTPPPTPLVFPCGDVLALPLFPPPHVIELLFELGWEMEILPPMVVGVLCEVLG